jgi:hypothetical protein
LLCTKSVLLHTFFTNGANPRKSVGSSCSSLFLGLATYSQKAKLKFKSAKIHVVFEISSCQ